MDQNNNTKDAPFKGNQAKKFAYTCIKKCVHQGRFCREGDVIYLDKPGEKVPYFEEVKNI